ncbi:MAG: hypothetical protein WA220_06160 [Candidatus Nitrosopolaris sp.]
MIVGDEHDISLGLECFRRTCLLKKEKDISLAKSTENRERLERVNHHRTKLKKSLAILI